MFITGATQPWSMKASDSEFNVGVSLGFLQAYQCGKGDTTGNVYVAMNGCVIPANHVIRDKSTGYFMHSGAGF